MNYFTIRGFPKGCRYLLHDRASVFSEDFRMILKAAGIESVRPTNRVMLFRAMRP